MTQASQTSSKRVISVFSLVMINIIAIDSLRSVPAAAEYGVSLIFYYAIAAIGFFIPSALVSAELATGWPKTGGVYVWVREAYGPRWGFVAIWLQWIENVIWYPTIMSFIAGTILFVVSPHNAENKYYLLGLMLVLFWAATFLNMKGMKISAMLSSVTAIIGTIIPMVFIIFLGAFSLLSGKASQISFSLSALIPHVKNLSSLAFLTGVLYSVVGFELSAAHAQDVKNPQRDYPRAMVISSIFIISSLILSSLAIAIVTPKDQINLVEGLVQAFSSFFTIFHISWMTDIIALMIVIGGFGGVSAWIIGPNKGLLAAAADDNLPAIFHKTNRHGAPTVLLWLQGVIFTALCSLFLFMPSVNSSYWILTALTAQLYMSMYILMFMAAIRLRYKFPEVKRSYRIPFGKPGIWLVAGIGILTSIATIFIGFLPPIGFNYGNIETYEAILATGFIALSLPPFIYSWSKKFFENKPH